MSILATQPSVIVATDAVDGATMRNLLEALKKDPHLKRVYMEPVGNTPQQMAAAIGADLMRWQPLIEKHKISLD